jgi:hypothetical protein
VLPEEEDAESSSELLSSSGLYTAGSTPSSSSAAEEEMEAHSKNGTWDIIVKLPPGKKAIGSRWFMKIKKHADGSIERYKARFVAKGYSQHPGFDYNDTFAPTVRYSAVRAILAIASLEDLELRSVDISHAYLNGVGPWGLCPLSLPTLYLLGIKIERNRPNHKLYLSQQQYVLNMLETFGLDDSNPVSTPMDPGLRLSAKMAPQNNEEVQYMKSVPYMNAVGKLMYLAITTRPDSRIPSESLPDSTPILVPCTGKRSSICSNI